MKTCSVCHKAVDDLFSGVKNGQYVSERCERCLALTVGSALYARKFERDRQREDYRKDILQRYDGDKPDKEWVDAYPEQAKRAFGEDVLRDYGRNGGLY